MAPATIVKIQHLHACNDIRVGGLTCSGSITAGGLIAPFAWGSCRSCRKPPPGMESTVQNNCCKNPCSRQGSLQVLPIGLSDWHASQNTFLLFLEKGDEAQYEDIVLQGCIKSTSLSCAAGRAPLRSCLLASMRSVAPTSFSSFSSPCSSSLHMIRIMRMCFYPAAQAPLWKLEGQSRGSRGRTSNPLEYTSASRRLQSGSEHRQARQLPAYGQAVYI